MYDYAWVTLATNDSYSLGALVLAHSLRNVRTSYPIVVMVTNGVSDPMKEKLRSVFNLVYEVTAITSKDEANLLLLQRPELGITFTKLHCWCLTQYEKCVFLDADTLVLKNCDELFERDEFSAAPDVGWPDCFNSGVFVYVPSETTFNSLLKFASDNGSFDGGDQGLLNLYFSDWSYKDIAKHLPFIYNMCSVASYSYLPALKQFSDNVKIIHFIGATKPWQQYYNPETSYVSVAPGLNHLRSVIHLWWSLFYSHVHPTLTKARTESIYFASSSIPISSNPISHNTQDDASQNVQISNTTILDLWDNYYSPVSPEPQIDEHIIQNTTIKDTDLSNHTLETHLPSERLEQTDESHTVQYTNVNSILAFNSVEACNLNVVSNNKSFESCNVLPEYQSFADLDDLNSSLMTDALPSPVNSDLTDESPNVLLDPSCSYQSSVISDLEDATSTNKIITSNNEQAALTNTRDAPDTNTSDQLTEALQCPFESQFRRQGWETGQVDYLGSDSFDNIWQKICQTLSATSIEKKDQNK